MKPVREIVNRDIVDDLWGAGYTIVSRSRNPDPFFVPPDIIPASRAYQWFHLVHDRALYEHAGWAAVEAVRHDGYFMPAGHVGNIEVQGLGLFEKPKYEVDADRQKNIEKAHQQVDDWKSRTGAEFSGGITVGGQVSTIGDPAEAEKIAPFVNTETKTIETTVRVPSEMMPHMGEVFEERDALYAQLERAWNTQNMALAGWMGEVWSKYQDRLQSNPELLKGPTLNALLLPYAIENVRKRLKL